MDKGTSIVNFERQTIEAPLWNILLCIVHGRSQSQKFGGAN